MVQPDFFFIHVQIDNNRPHRHLCCLAPGQGLIQVEAPSTDSGGQCSPPPGMNENKCTWYIQNESDGMILVRCHDNWTETYKEEIQSPLSWWTWYQPPPIWLPHQERGKREAWKWSQPESGIISSEGCFLGMEMLGVFLFISHKVKFKASLTHTRSRAILTSKNLSYSGDKDHYHLSSQEPSCSFPSPNLPSFPLLLRPRYKLALSLAIFFHIT